MSEQANLVDKAVAEGGAYEVLHKRLQEQGRQVREQAETLNQQRLRAFGDSRMEVAGRVRIRTENNCVARDIVQVGDLLLFGYNVFLGLKRETRVEDVFSLYRLVEHEQGYEAEPQELAASFLGQQSFINDFNELYTYYKDTRLLQLTLRDGKLLASFQIGERVSDIRVFRWAVSLDGRQVRYIDNRGERDIALPASFDFEWHKTTREMAVNGRHPHINILDRVFVETVGGDLTLKVENNTEDGLGIYREPVLDKSQSLDDAQIEYARLGGLILLKVLPYREERWRYLVFNSLTRKVERIDAIGQACIQLPEDHGIIFPGGYYLQNGEYKTFEQSMDGMRFKRMLRSPNGEDVQFVFYEPLEGRSVLLTYNLISRRLQNPIFGHGHARLEDGRMVIFSAEGDEPTRIHPMQIWQTPFYSEEYAARQPARGGFFGRIGNAELVRGISDLLGLAREIDSAEVSVARFSQLCQGIRRLFDAYHWLGEPECAGLAPLLREVAATGELVLDEFEKVESIRAQSARAMADAETRQKALLDGLRVEGWKQAQEYVQALNRISAQRGLLLTIRELRYIDGARIDEMEQALLDAHDRVAGATSAFLAEPQALLPFLERLRQLDQTAQAAQTVAALAEPLGELTDMAADLDMLSGLMAALRIDDATRRTRIAEGISEVYARLNQTRARAEQRRKGLGSSEAVAQFGAQFKLFGQSITGALALATDPERCDEQLSRLLVQLEELESQFGDHEQFLGDILAKREELLETFESHRQTLLDERQRKAQSLADAAGRILDGLDRRTARFTRPEELSAFFAGDPLILKLRELAERLRELGDSVRADDIEARLKGVRDQAVRAQRDQRELFEAGGNVIRLGPRHRFSVNTQELDLTLLPRGEQMHLHLTGTDFLEPLHDPELEALRAYWQLSLESESDQLYRGEYLAGSLLAAAERGAEGLSLDQLKTAMSQPRELLGLVREFAAPRYREGYQRGIHDEDALAILLRLLELRDGAGLLTYGPAARGFALFFWSCWRGEAQAARWPRRAASGAQVRRLFGHADGVEQLRAEARQAMARFQAEHGVPGVSLDESAEYLVEELAAERIEFVCSKYARELLEGLRRHLQAGHLWDDYQQALEGLRDQPAQRWALAANWLEGYCRSQMPELRPYVPEAVALSLVGEALAPRILEADLRFRVEGLLGEHSRIQDGALELSLDDFFQRLRQHRTQVLPALRRYQALRQAVLERERAALRLEEFRPRPLTSFVRNRLINEVYLGFIGDNLAKQMGTVGEGKRSDLMGLLMLISPPGYGKTTLMEYVAHRLGLIFMKINGPALGHEVRSIDPAQAPDATARQELEKLNLALEMGNNVMLYVDDIQHTHPEFLQKFISLCDGTRRIEGVWKGRTRTYDMRGKKFCVVMAGNPYTESGELFRIPDMLANRADIYNLGDTLGGMQEAFALSYIENCLTSNPVLAPLATRDLSDLYRFVERAEGKPFSANALSHDYSGAEINEITATLQRLLRVRDTVLRVNQQYITSAAQAEQYRAEPPFKLQGSYRNMNKLAEKISAVMNEDELRQLIADHYQGESQLLTSGAEENLLKLAELRGSLSAEQAERWTRIKRDFLRNKAIGGDADVGGRVVAQLHDLVEGVRALGERRDDTAEAEQPWAQLLAGLERLRQVEPRVEVDLQVVAPPQPGVQQLLERLADSLQNGFLPLVNAMDKKIDIDLGTHRNMHEMAGQLRELASQVGQARVARD